MRTTITLEEDVAALVRKAMKARRASLKVVVNEAIRAGLAPRTEHAREDGARFRTRSFDGGRCLIGNLDSVGEVLAILEGETYK